MQLLNLLRLHFHIRLGCDPDGTISFRYNYKEPLPISNKAEIKPFLASKENTPIDAALLMKHVVGIYKEFTL